MICFPITIQAEFDIKVDHDYFDSKLYISVDDQILFFKRWVSDKT